MPTIYALSKTIEDTNTLAAASHHVLNMYQVDLASKRVQATVASYAREEAQRPIFHVTVQLPKLPPAGADPVQWIYELLIAVDSEGNVLRGATPVMQVAAA